MNEEFQEMPWNTTFWGVQTWDGGFVWGSNRQDVEAYATRAPNSELVKTSWGKIKEQMEHLPR